MAGRLAAVTSPSLVLRPQPRGPPNRGSRHSARCVSFEPVWFDELNSPSIGAVVDSVLTFGVAGHVDHGKTTLVRCLTGIETDRLIEEQRRGISIELGFAHLAIEVEQGRTARLGFVDMPGHERFVRRMISGAAGIDAVLLVIAADEGVMPQGREHLAICELLGVRHGAIVLSKVDLADDELIDLLEDELVDLTRGTFLEGAPVWRFSGRTPEPWLASLREGLALLGRTVLAARGGDDGVRAFHMPVDRSFSMRGHGTVVTGTAASGVLAVEQVVEVLPGGARLRVRSIEHHGESTQTFEAPGRLAVNLASAGIGEVPVGSVLATPGRLPVTSRFDALLSTLAHCPALPLRQRVMIHMGTTQVEAAITQLNGEIGLPGSAALVQIHLDRPMPVAPGDHFVVRGSQVDARFGQTLAGGRVLHPEPSRHRLGDAAVLAALNGVLDVSPERRVEALVELAGVRGATDEDLARVSAEPSRLLGRAVEKLLSQGRLRRFGRPSRFFAPAAIEAIEARAVVAVDRHHLAHPGRDGLDPDEAARTIGGWLDRDAVGQVVAGLVRRGALVLRDGVLARPDFRPERRQARPAVVTGLVATVRAQGLAVDTPALLAERLQVDVAEVELALLQAQASGELRRINQTYWIDAELAERTARGLLDAYGGQESFSTSELKAHTQLTRKHLIPLAEFLDACRVTVRDPSGNRRFRQQSRERARSGRPLLGDT